MKKIIIALLIIAISNNHSLYAQGCSDAGFCSLTYHKVKEKKNSLRIGNVAGLGDGSTFTNNSYIGYTRMLGSSFSWDTKLTVNYASGALANHLNAGDLFTTLSFSPWKNISGSGQLNFLGGLKIPLSDANAKAGNLPLPMAYQASLGTTDLLAGMKWLLKNWEFTNAWQIPITGENKNTYLKEYAISNDFPSSNKLKRKPDVLFRAAYTLQKGKSAFSLIPNLLAIYHLGADDFENIYSKREKLTGSEGITLNGNIIARYSFKNKSSLELSLAAPFVAREIRPDGLTRKFTAGVEYRFSF